MRFAYGLRDGTETAISFLRNCALNNALSILIVGIVANERIVLLVVIVILRKSVKKLDIKIANRLIAVNNVVTICVIIVGLNLITVITSVRSNTNWKRQRSL